MEFCCPIHLLTEFWKVAKEDQGELVFGPGDLYFLARQVFGTSL